jgi:hypothetical protein
LTFNHPGTKARKGKALGAWWFRSSRLDKPAKFPKLIGDVAFDLLPFAPQSSIVNRQS